MYKILGMVQGNCDAKESHTNRKVIPVEDLLSRQRLHLCPRCFIAQLELRSKGQPDQQQ